MARGEVKVLAFSDGVSVTAATAAPVGSFYFKTDATGWDGAAYDVTYDLTVADDNGNTIDDATQMLWALKAPAGSAKLTMQGCTISHPAATSVRFVFGSDFPPASGTYYLVGR